MPKWLIIAFVVIVIGGLYAVSFWKTAKDDKARRILQQQELDQDREEALKKKAEYLAKKAEREATEQATAEETPTETEVTD